MVVISDIDDDPLIHRHLPSRVLRGELIMCCHCCAVHCRVSAQKVITTGISRSKLQKPSYPGLGTPRWISELFLQ